MDKPSRSGRRHGNGPSFPIPVWSGILDHRGRIGPAIWEFVWCLDKVTVEKAGVGLVLGGQPIKAAMIAAQIGKSGRRTREGLEHLEGAGYIRRRRTPLGYVIEVLNSRKFGVWGRTVATAENVRSEGGKRPVTTAENVRSNKDTAVRSTAEAAAETASAAAANPPGNHTPNLEAWDVLGLDRPTGPPGFGRLWESTYASRNGDALSVVMGRCLDGWQAAGGAIPARFAQAIRRIRESEREQATADAGEGYARL